MQILMHVNMFLSKTHSICRKKPFWLKNSNVGPQTMNLLYESEKEIRSETKETEWKELDI